MHRQTLPTTEELLNQLRLSSFYRAQGCIYSEQRVEVIEALSSINRPIDAERLWLHMVNAGNKVSLSCVRSSLNWLVQLGELHKHKNPKGIWEYAF